MSDTRLVLYNEFKDLRVLYIYVLFLRYLILRAGCITAMAATATIPVTILAEIGSSICVFRGYVERRNQS